MPRPAFCPDCELPATPPMNRRDFVKTAGAAAAAVSVASAAPLLAEAAGKEPEKLVETLYHSLTPDQKSKICFPWDYQNDRGLLRTHVSNNWQITDVKSMNVAGSFYSNDQRDLIEAIFDDLYNPDWRPQVRKQLHDDTQGKKWGAEQTIAIFGEPGTKQFEFVMTGRHLTIRCDGNSAEHVAFGGPIFYGHAAQGFNEKADHPGNVYWHQALKANKLYDMLDGKQREKALIAAMPQEAEVPFQGKDGKFPGIPIADLSADQEEHAQGVLKALLEPYRLSDREEASRCLATQGGLEKCSLAFYKEGDIGEDGVWDVWRIEGPSFVWHFRGSPHVHVWVNIADDPSPELNSIG